MPTGLQKGRIMNKQKNPEPTMDVQTERLLARSAAHSSRFLRIQVVAPSATSEAKRPPIRIAFVLNQRDTREAIRILGAGLVEYAKRCPEQCLSS